MPIPPFHKSKQDTIRSGHSLPHRRRQAHQGLHLLGFCYGRYYAITARNHVLPCTHCTKKNIFLCAIYHLYFLLKFGILYTVIKQTPYSENICSNFYGVEIIRIRLSAPFPIEGRYKKMNEKIFSVVRTSPFTAHYTVECTDGSLEVRTVHRCPKCGGALSGDLSGISSF